MAGEQHADVTISIWHVSHDIRFASAYFYSPQKNFDKKHVIGDISEPTQAAENIHQSLSDVR